MESEKRGKKIRMERYMYKGGKMGKGESKREGGTKGERKRVVQLVFDEAEGATGCCKNGF